ncbi:hypothetical protein FZI85_27465 [Mycobacterium sp. CBMA293]|uniref:Uncharacterized protein n=1 Tax=Mycolicibacterium sp. CBMA 213 TaxID=1968788 RepID=A0A1S6GKQ7_9MYCO|nr:MULTISPECIES: hypothetical protein [unclassified Mycolicibacterium]AQS22432.1 hypothetical protein pCBMA213_2_00068 [Mycolicibacterium sp. CBMA 213]MUL48335.1 hypothetical protein [Mycolicibacterium sp. CBMA 360]MUL62346.1 hypothetical protein [Mycolicibacterium sp. CBMA 335]MUM04483.1 hypothetical protein [Mycolicibacterium sp. CBMA 213]MUM14746.1 hypothetical protein [Mycolicibacterium sp. CBMA 293]
MNADLEREALSVKGVLSRAKKIFGGDVAPIMPPDFVAPRDLEDNLGKGYFGAPASSSTVPESMRRRPQSVDAGGDESAVVDDDRLVNDFHDRLVTSGAWTWADRGVGR